MKSTLHTLSSKPKKDSRNSIIDLIRIIAAFGVIFIHVHTESNTAENVSFFFLKLCVPFFFTTSLVYFVQSLDVTISVKTIIGKIWKRIGIPFLAWTVIYLGLRTAKYLITGSSTKFTINLLVRAFLYGESSEQMYYLPELIIMQFSVLGIFLLVTRINRSIGLYLLIFSIVYLYWGYIHNYYGVTSLSHFLVYIIAAFYLNPAPKASIKKWMGIIVGIIFISIATSKITHLELPVLTNVISDLPIGGLGLLLIGINTPAIQLPAWIKTLSVTSYGIYLSHVVFLEFMESFFDKFNIKIIYNFPLKVVLSFLVFIVCVVFVLIVKRVTILNLILLGENKV